MCFNGAKSFQLGWYKDGHKEINPIVEDYYGRIVGFVNHRNKTKNLDTIIKLKGHNNGLEYYIHFNRKSDFNFGTQEGEDSVIITSRPEGIGLAQSLIVAKLEYEYDTHV